MSDSPRMGTVPAATIHLLTKSRRAACGKLVGEPHLWPSGHLWAKVERGYMVNCDRCRDILRQINAAQSKSKEI